MAFVLEKVERRPSRDYRDCRSRAHCQRPTRDVQVLSKYLLQGAVGFAIAVRPHTDGLRLLRYPPGERRGTVRCKVTLCSRSIWRGGTPYAVVNKWYKNATLSYRALV